MIDRGAQGSTCKSDDTAGSHRLATAEDLMAEAAKAAVAECLDTQTCEARHKRHAALSASV